VRLSRVSLVTLYRYHPCHSHSHHALPAPPPILLRPPRRAGFPRADRLSAGEMPRGWRAAVGCDCGNGGVFPGGARLPRLPPPHSQRLHKTPTAVKGHSQHQRHQPPETSRCPCKTLTPSGSGTPCSKRHQSGHGGTKGCSYCRSSSDRISSRSPSGSIHSSNSETIDKASPLLVIPYLILLILHSLM